MKEITNKYQTFWKRFWAYFIDVLIFNIVMYVLLHFVRDNNLLDATTFLAVMGAVWVSYRVIMHNQYGQTIGKKVTNLLVVHKNESFLLTLKESFIRESVSVLIAILSVLCFIFRQKVINSDSILAIPDEYSEHYKIFFITSACALIIVLVIAVISTLINEKHRGLHDKIGNAVVIRSEFWKEKADQ